MTIGDRIKLAADALLGRKALVGLDFLMGTDASVWRPRWNFETLAGEGYEYNAIIYGCITALMEAMKEAPMLVEVQNRKGEWEEKPDHALARLLARPNPDMTEDDFQAVTTLYQKLAGNAFWEKERSKAGNRVVGLWPMRPDKVGIVASKSMPGQRVNQRIQGYTWQGDQGQVTLPATDVVHFKEYHPRDDLFGLPPLAAGAREGDTDNQATNYVGSFFNNAAVPKGLMKVSGRVDEATEKRVIERLKQMYGGRSGWHDPLILGEGAEWVELAETFKDMDFPNLRQITETRICMLFKVPPIIAGTYAGLQQATYSNYAEARSMFTQTVVIGMYRQFDTVLNRMLVWPDFGMNVRVRSDVSRLGSLSEDMNEVWARATAAFNAGAITVNDFRYEVGLDPVQGGDVFLRGMMVTEVPATIEVPKAIEVTSQTKALPEPKEQKYDGHARRFDIIARSWESRFREKAQELFRQELEHILDLLKREGKATKQGGPFAQFALHVMVYLMTRQDAWSQAYFGLMGGLMDSQAENLAGYVAIDWSLERPEVQQFLHGYTVEFADEVVGTTEMGLRGLIMTAQEDGWSVPQLRDEITGLFDEFDRVRATNIARTETIRSSNAGTYEMWRLAGIERTQWYAHVDERTCPFCMDLHSKYGPGTPGLSMTETFAYEGEVISVDVTQPDGTLATKKMTTLWASYYPPLHNQCRCTILAVVE